MASTALQIERWCHAIQKGGPSFPTPYFQRVKIKHLIGWIFEGCLVTTPLLSNHKNVINPNLNMLLFPIMLFFQP